MAGSGSLTVNIGANDNDYSLYTPPEDISGKSADNTQNPALLAGKKGAYGWIYWPFDVSKIPQNAQIDSVFCRFRARVNSTSYCGSATGYLCSGTTIKTGDASFLSSTSNVYTLSGGVWTRDEIADCRLKLYVYFNSDATPVSRRYFYIYGADLTVTYTYQSEKFMLKLGGSWTDVARVFKKVSGIWVEQESLEGVVDTSKKLVTGGEIN